MKRQVIGLSLTLAVSLGMLPLVQMTARAEELAVTEETETADVASDYAAAGDDATESGDTEQSEVNVAEPSGDTEEAAPSSDDIQVLDNTEEFSATAPQLTELSGVGTHVTLQWDALDGAEQYVIYRRGTPDAASSAVVRWTIKLPSQCSILPN